VIEYIDLLNFANTFAPSQQNGYNSNSTIQTFYKTGRHMRSGIVEFGAGSRYNYIAGFDPLSNVYPVVSLSIDFLRYSESAKHRNTPGFGMLMKMLDH